MKRIFVLVILFATSIAYASDGRVVDANTHAAIPEATVTTGSEVALTNSSGYFSYKDAVTSIMARAPGYLASHVSAGDLQRNGGTLQLTPFLPHAVYLTIYGIGSSTLRGSALALAKAGSINALVIDLKGDRGFIPYPSTIRMAQKNGARTLTTIRDLRALATQLHQAGIYAIARIVVFKDNPLATSRPDIAVKRSDGSLFRDREGLAWTDPFQPDVRAYNIAIAVEAARAGFDEVQFDYVRFPDVAQKLRFAKTPTEELRIQAIDRFLSEAQQALIPFNVFLSVDIFGYVCWNTSDTGIGQRLENILPLVDYLAPMVYPSGYKYGIPGCQTPVAHPYEVVRDTLENARKRGIPPMRLRPWLQGFRDYAFDHRTFGPLQVNEQIRAARDFGSDGWMIWNPHNHYEGLGLEASDPNGRRAR